MRQEFEKPVPEAPLHISLRPFGHILAPFYCNKKAELCCNDFGTGRKPWELVRVLCGIQIMEKADPV